MQLLCGKRNECAFTNLRDVQSSLLTLTVATVDQYQTVYLLDVPRYRSKQATKINGVIEQLRLFSILKCFPTVKYQRWNPIIWELPEGVTVSGEFPVRRAEQSQVPTTDLMLGLYSVSSIFERLVYSGSAKRS